MLTIEDISKIGTFLNRRDVTTVKLSGGEPTIRKDLPQIIRIFGNRGIRPTLITNGISITESVFQELKAASGELKFSIHRPDSNNDHVFRVRSFSRILTNIKTARSRSIPFSINTVVTPATIALMPNMVDFGIDQGARKISFIPVVPRGRARAQSALEFSVTDLEAVRAEVTRLAQGFKAQLDVRCIDIRTHDYWVIENDGSLWIERARDDDDLLVCQKDELMTNTDRVVHFARPEARRNSHQKIHRLNKHDLGVVK